jgi:hypothetical protein
MWLALIHTKRVKPEKRPLLERYQKEAARVLRDHFLRPQPQATPVPANFPEQLQQAL